MMSAAFFWPMPWMYWSAIRTRLLVGIFTPAIRATDFSPVADPSRTGLFFRYLGQVFTNANTTPSPLCLGARHRLKTIRLDTGLLKDSNWFRQPSLCFSSLFRDLFGGFSTPLGRLAPGTLPRSLAGLFGRLFSRRFSGLGGALPGLFGCLFGNLGGF